MEMLLSGAERESGMETRYRVGGVASETGKQAADALAAALGLHHVAVAQLLVMLDDVVRGEGHCKAATVRVDFQGGGRLIIEEGEEGHEEWSHFIPRLATRTAKGVQRELERRWERIAM